MLVIKTMQNNSDCNSRRHNYISPFTRWLSRMMYYWHGQFHWNAKIIEGKKHMKINMLGYQKIK